ncbi:MAG: hypothetical protein ACI9Z9_000664, partial [Litorivivens sp.]
YQLYVSIQLTLTHFVFPATLPLCHARPVRHFIATAKLKACN